jgi:amino acid transporter
MGIEIIALTAYEARDVSDIRWPSKLIPIVVFFLYFLCTFGEILNVSWTDPDLPTPYDGTTNNVRRDATTNSPSSSMAIIAFLQTSHAHLASFINGALIFSALSAANTNLYTASRTLFGLTWELRSSPRFNFFTRRVVGISILDRKVPIIAILISCLSLPLYLPLAASIKNVDTTVVSLTDAS